MELPTGKGAYCLHCVNPLSMRLFNHAQGVWQEAVLHWKCYASQHNYDINCPGQPLPTTPVFSTPQAFHCHSDIRCPVSKSFFTHPSKCYSSSFSITWPFLSAPARFHLSAVSHSSQICVLTSHILEQSGILFGAVLPPFFHVCGRLFIQICCVLSRGRWRIIFKGGYGTHFFCSPNISFCCSYVLCWCLSMY